MRKLITSILLLIAITGFAQDEIPESQSQPFYGVRYFVSFDTQDTLSISYAGDTVRWISDHNNHYWWVNDTILAQNYIGLWKGLDTGYISNSVKDKQFLNADEADPLFKQWDKSRGINISTKQVTDLQSFLLTNFDSTGFEISESQVYDLQDYLLNADLDSIRGALLNHSDSLVWIGDSITNYDLRLIEVEGLDTAGIYHANRELLDAITETDTTNWGNVGVDGSGTIDYLPKWTSVEGLGNSPLFVSNNQIKAYGNDKAPEGTASIMIDSDGDDTYFETFNTDMSGGLLINGYTGYAGVINQMFGNTFTSGWDKGLHVFSDTGDPLIFKSYNDKEYGRFINTGRFNLYDTLDMGTSLIRNVKAPVSDLDAANKKYVDDNLFTNTDETDPVFNAHLASDITATDTTNWGAHFTTADETDPIYSGDSANIVWFSDLDYFTTADETDPIYSSDSANIVWFSDLLDNDSSNELNTSASWNSTTNTLTVSDPGGDVSAEITGFLESETTMVTEQFTATTNQTTFTLSNSADANNDVQVAFNGNSLDTSKYTVTGNELSLTFNAYENDQVQISYFK